MDHSVSIIIPLYNSALYIEKCVRSCLAQTYENIEVIVVDDGSTDNGLSVVKTIATKDKRVRAFRKNNGGVSSARNMGIEKAGGEFVCFVDADDYLDVDFIEKMVKSMARYNADFCFSNRVWNENVPLLKFNYRVVNSATAEAALLSTRIPVGCWNKMYSKKCLRDIKFDEQLFYGEGLKFIVGVANKANKIVMCNCSSYHYQKVNPESATTKFDLDKMDNGNRALEEIRKIIGDDGRRVMLVWRQHHALFCLNAMMGVLDISAGVKEFAKWRRKFLRDAFVGIFSEAGFKSKLKIMIGILSPRLLHSFSRRKKNEQL